MTNDELILHLKRLQVEEHALATRLDSVRWGIQGIQRTLRAEKWEDVDTGMRIFGVPVYEEVRRE